jgi:hypothetical protein
MHRHSWRAPGVVSRFEFGLLDAIHSVAQPLRLAAVGSWAFWAGLDCDNPTQNSKHPTLTRRAGTARNNNDITVLERKSGKQKGDRKQLGCLPKIRKRSKCSQRLPEKLRKQCDYLLLPGALESCIFGFPLFANLGTVRRWDSWTAIHDDFMKQFSQRA